MIYKYCLHLCHSGTCQWGIKLQSLRQDLNNNKKKNLAKFQCIIYPEIQFLDMTSRFDLQKICSTFPNIEDSTEVHKS